MTGAGRSPSGHGSGRSRQRFPAIAEQIGEDPAKYLDQDLLMDADAREMFEARLRGIRKRAVVARWLEVEHRLERDACPRESVVEKLEQRGQFLDEHGDQVPPEDVGRSQPIHTGGDPADPPPKSSTRVGINRFAEGAARHYHYITKAKPFLEARDRADDADEPTAAAGDQRVATDGGPVEPAIYEASLEGHIVAECPGCLDAMLLGEIWSELILEDGHDVPECPDCNTGPDEWRDDADPKLDGHELAAIQGERIHVDGGDG